MIDAKQIPDEVVEAAGRAYEASCRKLSPTEIPMRAAIAAALAAWPGAFEEYMNVDEGRAVPCIVLPKEASDD